MSMTVGDKYAIFKTFPAKLEKLPAMLQFVLSYARTINFESGNLLKIELAMEEALVNTINYGYGQRHGFIEIHCGTFERGGICMVIKDQGIAFNPLLQEGPSGFDDVGGWGLFLIRKVMDDVQYRHENGTNILTLIKYK